MRCLGEREQDAIFRNWNLEMTNILTKVEPPHLVERLPLALPSEDDHDGEELYGAVAVEAPGAGAGLDRAPTAGDEVEAPEV